MLVACNNLNNRQLTSKEDEVTSQNKSAKKKKKETSTFDDNEATLFGYRFQLTGDFNGDGKKEQLTEHFVSRVNGEEINQFLATDDEDGRNLKRIEKWQSYSFIASNSPKIDTLFFEKSEASVGLAFLKNEGDLDGDGGDEISYVVRWADISSLNTCYVMSYKNNKWEKLYSFPIWDWQLPELPIYTTKTDWEKRNLKTDEKSVNHFAGLIKKVEPKMIQIVYRNEDAEEDTSIVNL